VPLQDQVPLEVPLSGLTLMADEQAFLRLH